MTGHGPVNLVWHNRSLLPLAVATVATSLDFYVPVSAVFLLHRGVSLQDVFVLESVLLSTILLAEVPSGVIGDRLDRRTIICCGFVFNGVAETLFACGHSFAVYAVSFAVSGLGIAMLTGVQDAYVYESLGDDAEEVSVAVWGHFSTLSLCAGVVSSVVGSLLASINLSWPAVATAVVAWIGAGAAFLLPSQNYRVVPHGGESPLHTLADGTRLLFRSPVLLYAALGSSAVFVLFNSVFTLNQPIFEMAGVPVALWGTVAGVSKIIAAIYNQVAGKIVERLGRNRALILAMSLGAGGFMLMAFPFFASAIGGYVLVTIGMHARGPIVMSVANGIIPSDRRATVLNVASSFGSLLGIVMNPVIGWFTARSVTGLVLGISIVLFGVGLSWIPIANRHLVEDSRVYVNRDSDGPVRERTPE